MEFKNIVDNCGDESRVNNPILNALDLFTKDKHGMRVCIFLILTFYNISAIVILLLSFHYHLSPLTYIILGSIWSTSTTDRAQPSTGMFKYPIYFLILRFLGILGIFINQDFILTHFFTRAMITLYLLKIFKTFDLMSTLESLKNSI